MIKSSEEISTSNRFQCSVHSPSRFKEVWKPDLNQVKRTKVSSVTSTFPSTRVPLTFLLSVASPTGWMGRKEP